MSKVSIILTSYNRPEWLKNAIESVVTQTYADWELWIMDDNSPNPELRRLVSDYINDRRINFWQSNVTLEDRAKTARYATLINTAYPWTTGKYISYLTDDDDYLPIRLERMVNFLDSVPEAKVVYGFQMCYDDGVETSHFIRATPGPLTQAASLVDHNSVMHHRDIGIEVGLWEDGPECWGHGDAIFWQKLNDAGYKFYSIPEVLDRHRGSRDSAQNKMLNGRMPYEEW